MIREMEDGESLLPFGKTFISIPLTVYKELVKNSNTSREATLERIRICCEKEEEARIKAEKIYYGEFAYKIK